MALGMPGAMPALFALAMLSALSAAPTVSAAEYSAADLAGIWVGSFDQDSHETHGAFKMILTVEQVVGREFTGMIDWPDNGDSRTKVQGMYDAGILKWTETEYLRGDDVVLYGLYIGRFRGHDEIAGDWMDPKHTIRPAGPAYGTSGGAFVLRREEAGSPQRVP